MYKHEILCRIRTGLCDDVIPAKLRPEILSLGGPLGIDGDLRSSTALVHNLVRGAGDG